MNPFYRKLTLIIFGTVALTAPVGRWAYATTPLPELPSADSSAKNISRPSVNQSPFPSGNSPHQPSEVDEETSRILKTLRNPFVPQLPRTETPAPIVNNNSETQPTPKTLTTITPAGMAPTAAPTPTKPDFKIAGMVWNTQRPQAIINGIIVDEGQSIESWKIKSITREGVKVENSGYEYLLKP